MVAIIIPLYHARDTLPQALDSLVSQTKKTFMVIPSIDGDNENYDDIFEEYTHRGLHIYPIYSKENGGPGIARQRGIDAARMCDYLIFLDADDLLMPRAVEILSYEAMSKGADIVTGEFYTEKDSHMAEITEITKHSVTWMHGKIYRRQYLIDKDIRFLPQFRFNEDSYFNLVAFNCSKKIYRIEEPVYIWRKNKNSITRSVSGKELHERIMSTYVNTQILGLDKTIKTVGDVSSITFAATLINIYTHIMRSRYYKITTNNYEENFTLLKNNKILQDKFNDINVWKCLVSKVTQGTAIENTFFFYKQNILEWLNENIINKELSDGNNN